MNVRTQRWSMAAGIAFAVLVVVGFVIQFSGLPDYDGEKDSRAVIGQKVHEALASSGHRAQAIVGAYLLVLAALCLVAFAAGLRARLLAADPDRVVAGSVVTGSAVLAAAGLALGAGLNALVPGAIAFGSEAVPDVPDSYALRFLSEAGAPLMFLVFGLGVAVLVATMTVAALQGVGLPRWLGYAGWLAVLGGVLTAPTGPLLLVLPLLWAVVVGVLGLRVRTAVPLVGPVAGGRPVSPVGG